MNIVVLTDDNVYYLHGDLSIIKNGQDKRNLVQISGEILVKQPAVEGQRKKLNLIAQIELANGMTK